MYTVLCNHLEDQDTKNYIKITIIEYKVKNNFIKIGTLCLCSSNMVIHVYSMHVQCIIPNDIQYPNFHLPARRVGVHHCVQR